MEQISKITKQEALKVLETFTNNFQSLILSTVSIDQKPFASYAPFVEDEKGCYYICISGYVPHAHNLTDTKIASIMFIEDEKDAIHPFGRRRLYFDADAKKFDEKDSQKDSISKLFSDKFGDKVSFMLTMPDFRIYKLIPKNGSLVLGFGAAYNVSDDKKSLKPKNALHENRHEDSLSKKPI